MNMLPIRHFTPFEKAIHEAGHVVIAYLMGLGITRVTIVPEGGNDGLTELLLMADEIPRYRRQPETSHQPDAHYCLDFIAFAAAGHEAHAKYFNAPAYTMSDRFDILQMKDYGKSLADFLHCEVVDIVNDQRERVQKLLAIADNWDAVLLLAYELMQQQTMDITAINTVLDPFQLTCIYTQKERVPFTHIAYYTQK